MIGSLYSICLIVHLLLSSSSVYTTAKPRVEKDIKSDQWPSGYGCTIVDGLVCGEKLKYFCEWETGVCTECEDHYCNPLLSTSEKCENKCPAYYQQGYYIRNVIGKATGKFHSTTTNVGSLPNSIVQNNQTNNGNKSSTPSTKNKDNVKTQHASRWPIFNKVISVVSIAIFFVFSASLGFLLNKHFGLIKRIKTYFSKRFDHLPIPVTNSDDRNSPVELEEHITKDVIIDHPTDNDTDSYPNEHNILHPEEREKLGLLVKVDIDAGPLSTSTHLLDCSATARCTTENLNAEPRPIQNT